MIKDLVLPNLIWAEGKWTTKNGRLGDAMSANAAFACSFPDDSRPRDYVKYSFIGDRPFRSPLHAKDPLVDLTTSFSRDHCLSLCWYSLWTKDTDPLEKIARYAGNHWLKIGREGNYSQHGLTPNVMWAMGSVIHFFGLKSLPIYYRFWPSSIIAAVQLVSAKTVTVGYRLNLCGELALIARITGQWNFIWQAVIDTCVSRQPNNLYYLYIQGRSSRSGLLGRLQMLAKDYRPNDEWCWNWMRFKEGRLSACGQDLLLLEALLQADIF